MSANKNNQLTTSGGGSSNCQSAPIIIHNTNCNLLKNSNQSSSMAAATYRQTTSQKQAHKVPRRLRQQAATIGSPTTSRSQFYNDSENLHRYSHFRSASAINNVAPVNNVDDHQNVECRLGAGSHQIIATIADRVAVGTSRDSSPTSQQLAETCQTGAYVDYSTLRGRYSSSQAHLQSLTSLNLVGGCLKSSQQLLLPPTTIAPNSSTARVSGGGDHFATPSARKTTPKPTPQQLNSHPQQHQYRSQQSLAVGTKPMTSMLNEPSTFGGSHSVTRSQCRAASVGALANQHQQVAGGANLSTNFQTTANSSQTQHPPPYSRTAEPQQQQFPGQPIDNNSTRVPAGSNRTQATGPTSNSLSQPQPSQSSATASLQQQQRVFNYFSAQVPQQQQQQPPLPSHNFPPFNTQQYSLLHGQAHNGNYHQNTLINDHVAVAAAAAANNLLQGRPQLLAGLSKSKSYLACADISIKWYIVVIALLGLICALIGTIVGAVHSAGRDYISLALLLLGK